MVEDVIQSVPVPGARARQPTLDRERKRKTVKRAWLFILIGVACLVLGLITGRDLFYNIVYLAVLLLVSSLIWTWVSVNSVRISRRTRSRRSSVGKIAEESLSVTNTGFLPKVWLEVHDHSTCPRTTSAR